MAKNAAQLLYGPVLVIYNTIQMVIQRSSLPVGPGETGVYITVSSPAVSVKTEKQIYEATSFVGDIGGSLGLFLGFSLLMVWDWIQRVGRLIKSIMYF